MIKTAASLFWVVGLALSIRCYGATLIVPGEQPALTIPAGEAILIDFYSPVIVPSYIQLVSDGTTNSIDYFSPTPDRPAVLAGPLGLVFPPNSSVPAGTTILPQLINYKTLGRAAISSLVLRDGVTNTIEVPTNKTIHFFPIIYASGASASVCVIFQRGTNSAEFFMPDGFDSISKSEFTGPITIRLLGAGGTLVSYQLVEDFSALPDLGAVQVPAGSSMLTIEKSLNLKDWHPIFLHQGMADQQAFYRFKVNR